MIDPKQIPMEVKFRLRAILHDGETDEARALAAALNAWPEAGIETYVNGDSGIYLPFPTEKPE